MTDTSVQEPEYLSIVRREPLTDGSLTWLAYHPDLPGCMSHGDTPEEALAGLSEAREMVLRYLREHGIAPPAPGSSKVAQTVLAAG
ncbi:MAG TPA: type II toxin-antitoxin system HicB family antitoxin [Dehalococcoidia bacterium]|nr:type II toxin-antitoxin system HicB family antitoxin [Dehalococcoidia bacterium]